LRIQRIAGEQPAISPILNRADRVAVVHSFFLPCFFLRAERAMSIQVMYPIVSVPDNLLKHHKNWWRGIITIIELIRHADRFLNVEQDTMDAVNIVEKITNPIHVFFKVQDDSVNFVNKFKEHSIEIHPCEPPDWAAEKGLLECKWLTVHNPSAEIIDYLRKNAKPVYSDWS
jgi:hypothetical protein